MHASARPGPPTTRHQADDPHVLFLGHGAERTGPPILLGHLLRGLAAQGGLRCSVLTARAGPLLDDYRAAGAQARAVTSAREPLEPLAAALRRAGAGSLLEPLQRRVRARAARGPAADLLYVNAATPATAALLRAVDRNPDVAVLLHVHELDVGLRLTLDAADRAYLLGRADRLIAASAPVATTLVERHGIEAHRVTTCDEFVDVAAVQPAPKIEALAELGVPAGELVVGSVGLPDWRKDPERLVHAVAQVRRDHPAIDPWVVWLGGDPASIDGQHLADEARRVGLGGRFVHRGHLDRPDRLLGAFDVFALPAREDAFPLAALEAAAAGLPIVCFRTGGVAGLADLGAGLAVDHPDVGAFAAALADLLADEGLRHRTGAIARSLVAEQHDVAVGSARIRAVIETTLAEGTARVDR